MLRSKICNEPLRLKCHSKINTYTYHQCLSQEYETGEQGKKLKAK